MNSGNSDRVKLNMLSSLKAEKLANSLALALIYCSHATFRLNERCSDPKSIDRIRKTIKTGKQRQIVQNAVFLSRKIERPWNTNKGVILEVSHAERALRTACSKEIGIPPIAGCNASRTGSLSCVRIQVAVSTPTLKSDNSRNEEVWIRELSFKKSSMSS